MKSIFRSGQVTRPHEMRKLIISAFGGILFGFFLGASFPTLSSTKMSLPSFLFPSIDLAYIEDKYSGLSTQAMLNSWSTLKRRNAAPYQRPNSNDTKVLVTTNPRGAETLPPGIVVPETDLYLRRLWGRPEEDLPNKPKYLVTFTVGYAQKANIDKCVKKFSESFTIVLFHYDGRASEWQDLEWSKRAIHVSGRKQTKWWYAKRFLHPDVVAAYDYIFIWDEDLGVEHFNAEEYVKLVKKHGLEISQPGLEPNPKLIWKMTQRRDDTEVHKVTKVIEEKPGRCPDPLLPPCAAFIEIMAPVFSRSAWRCVWHLIQNDLVHGWGLDFSLRKCVEPAHEKIGVVDSQSIVHQSIRSLGNQDEANGKSLREGVQKRCRREWTIFQDRLVTAEQAYYHSLGIAANTTSRYPTTEM